MKKQGTVLLKHIKKKTVNHATISVETLDEIGIPVIPKGHTVAIKYKDVKDKNALLFMESGEMFHAFFYNYNGKVCTIPLANPVLIYFNTAQSTLKEIYAVRSELLELFNE